MYNSNNTYFHMQVTPKTYTLNPIGKRVGHFNELFSLQKDLKWVPQV